MARRANIVRVNEDVYLIDDAGESTCYLVTGRDRALLIDTANGMENLRDIVEELTKLPITVVNTHGHGDHVFGNIYFEEAYLHPADFELHDSSFAFPPAAEELKKLGLKPAKLLPLAEDAVFDLGGITLEVVPVKGHTPGCVTLLCRKHRILFSGDAVIAHLWMQLDHSLPLSILKQSLEALLNNHGDAFDVICTGHSKGPEDKTLAEELLKGANELLAGACEKDVDYPWFGRTDMAHPVNAEGTHKIVYNKTNLDIERGIRPPYPPILHVKNNPSLAGMADTRQNIVFSTATGQPLSLALISPWGIKEKTEPVPLVVFVQGSAWTCPDLGYEMGQMAYYAQHGIAVAMVTHRNCLEGHPFPAFLQDVKTAIRFLKSHAKEYNIDKERIGIWGTSSGGNTALLVGLTCDDPAYKTEECIEESDAVKAVVECFGPTDLNRMLGGDVPDGPHGDIFRALVGTNDVKQVFHDMSPVNHVKAGPDYPPFLMLSGSADPLVPFDQLEIMYRKLHDHGADVQAVCVDGAPHEDSFWSREVYDLILTFVKEKL